MRRAASFEDVAAWVRRMRAPMRIESRGSVCGMRVRNARARSCTRARRWCASERRCMCGGVSSFPAALMCAGWLTWEDVALMHEGAQERRGKGLLLCWGSGRRRASVASG